VNIKELVGKNLGILRKELGLSLEKVAELTGVSKSMLSEIEKGNTNPTIAVLWKIANGLKIPFSKLIKSEKEIFQVVKEEEKKTIFIDDNVEVYCVYNYDENCKNELYEMKIAPGHSHISESHGENVFEHVYIKKGCLLMKTENSQAELEERDSLKFLANSKHEYINNCKGYLELLIFLSYS